MIYIIHEMFSMPIPRVTHQLSHTCLCQVWQSSLVMPMTPIYRAFVSSLIPNAMCQWVTNPESYHSTLGLSDKHDRVFHFGQQNFWLTPRVSYTHTEILAHATGLLHPYRNFGSCRRSLTPMFQAFHLRGLTTPFLLRSLHNNCFSFYY